MTLTATTIRKLNRMNRAAQDAVLGTLLSGLESRSITSGSLAVSSAQSNASAVDIATGLTGVTWFDIDVYRSGSSIQGAYVVNSGSNLLVTNSTSASFVLTTADRINWAAK